MTKVNEAEAKLLEQYSENWPLLLEFLSKTEIQVIFLYLGEDKEIKFPFPAMRPHYLVRIKGLGKEFEFNYTGSVNDGDIIRGVRRVSERTTRNGKPIIRHTLEEIVDYRQAGIYDARKRSIAGLKKAQKDQIDHLLYSVLTCIRCEYDIPCRFEHFCNEFGYDADSIKALEVHKACLKNSDGLKTVIEAKYLEAFPS